MNSLLLSTKKNISLLFQIFSRKNRDVLCEHIIRNLPSAGMYYEFRWKYYKKHLKACGKFYTASGVVIDGMELISIGEGSWFNVGCWLKASGDSEIIIGKQVMCGPYCVIVAETHSIKDVTIPMVRQQLHGKSIIIEDDCWLGAHVVVKDGVKIGKGSVIGANSFVNKDIPAFSIAVGSPAKVIKSRI